MASKLDLSPPKIERGQGFALSTSTPVQSLVIARIRTDGGTQARADISPDTVNEYTQAMQDGAVFPPVIVYYDGTDHWLADGFHRVSAAQRIGLEIQAEIRPGTKRDAVLYALGANAQHGLRRTRADVQRSIDTMLRDTEWRQWSDREIARRVGCDHKTVAAARERLAPSGEFPQIETRTVERNGTVYQQAARSEAQRESPPADQYTTPEGWRWELHGGRYRLLSDDGWATNYYSSREDAIKEAAQMGGTPKTIEPTSLAQVLPLPLRKRAEALGVQISSSYGITDRTVAVWLPGKLASQWMTAEQLEAWCDGQATPAVQQVRPTPPQGWTWKENGGYLWLIDQHGWSTSAYDNPQRALADAEQHIAVQRDTDFGTDNTTEASVEKLLKQASQWQPGVSEHGRLLGEAARVASGIHDRDRQLGLMARIEMERNAGPSAATSDVDQHLQALTSELQRIRATLHGFDTETFDQASETRRFAFLQELMTIRETISQLWMSVDEG